MTIGVTESGFEEKHNVFHNNLDLGFNVRDENNNITNSLVPYIGRSHGTHVAGILAQMNDTLTITPIKVGQLLYHDIVKEGIIKAKEVGVTAFNLSLRVENYWEFYLPALLDLANSGAIISLSACNEAEYLNNPNIRIGNKTQSLADWLRDAKGRIVLVGATERKNDTIQQAPYSNKCPDSLLRYFISAPGTKIMSSVLNDKFAERDGTSMAAPIFLGAVVRLATVFDISLDRAREVLFTTAANGKTSSDGVKISYDPSLGQGMLDFSAAWNLLEKETLTIPQDIKPNIMHTMKLPTINKGKISSRNEDIEYKRRIGLHELADVDLGFMKQETGESIPIFKAYKKLPVLKDIKKEK